MNNPLARVPKWAWFVAAGVGVGGVALRKRQASKDAETAAVTGTDPSTGQATGTAAPGVIVPPVIMGGGGDSAPQSIDPAITTIYTNLGDTLTTGFSNVLGTISRHDDSLISLIANGGGSPNPASQQPTVINVTPPAPAPTAAPVPTPNTGNGCSAKFPHKGADGCYNDCGWDDCQGGKKVRKHGHCYQDGHTVVTSVDALGGKC